MSDRADWRVSVEQLSGGRGLRHTLFEGEQPLSFERVLRLWQDDPGFRAYFTEQLAAAPYAAFRWETPALARRTARRPFEYVLLNAPFLDVAADRETFAAAFAEADDGIAEFDNLGGDARLLAPAPVGPAAAYPHLAAFLRSAPDWQRHALWQRVGVATEQRLGDRPLWLSTAGGGVAWLHVRLDDRPKYYAHRPYREPPSDRAGL